MSIPPSIDFSTRRLAYAARLKGIPLGVFSGWLTTRELEVANEVYKGPIYDNADLYVRMYGVEE